MRLTDTINRKLHPLFVKYVIRAYRRKIRRVEQDLLGKRNGVSFNPRDESAIAFAFEWLMKLGTEELDAAYDESIELSHLTSISKFVESVQTIVSRRGRRGI